MEKEKNKIMKKTAIVVLLLVFLAFGVFGQELLSQIAPEVEDESESTATIVQIAEGFYHVLALDSEGKVWAWGRNNYGQIGNGTTVDTNEPELVLGLSDVEYVSAGEGFSVAVKSDGTVWAWGRNNLGQLGNGTTQNSTVPVRVSGLNNIVKAECGNGHTVALSEYGAVWSWGYNGSGQLGNGRAENSTVPVEGVDMLSLWCAVDVDAGFDHSIALTATGEVMVWGNNRYGQTAAEGTGANGTAQILYFPSSVVGISAGWYHNVVACSDGSVYTWGRNDHGQLGLGYTSERVDTPSAVGVSGMGAVFAGSYSSVAVSADGASSYVWGRNDRGQLGLGNKETPRSSPVAASEFHAAEQYGFGASFTVSLDNGEVSTWGRGSYGELGNSTNSLVTSPVAIDVFRDKIRFDEENYAIAYTADVPVQITVTASLYDAYKNAKDGSEISYSFLGGAPVSPYLSIDAQSGTVSYTPPADIDEALLPVSEKIVARIGSIFKIANISFEQIAMTSLSVDVQENENIYVSLTGENVPMGARSFSVSYDAEKLVLCDAAAQVYGVQLSVGEIGSSGVFITAIGDGVIKFETDRDVAPYWTGTVTVLRFSASSAAQSEITVGM